MNFKPARKSNLRLSERVNEGPIALHFRWSVKQLTLNEPGYYYYLKLVISVIIFIAADLQYVALIIVFIRRATLLLLMINI